MPAPVLSRVHEHQIAKAVEAYKDARVEYGNIAHSLHKYLSEDATLHDLIHSSKYRTKEPDRLRDKLRRKCKEALRAGKRFTITSKNLFARCKTSPESVYCTFILRQMGKIDGAIRAVLDRYQYVIVGSPTALTWDRENEAYFKGLGMVGGGRQTMYTSVHYIIRPATNPDKCIELQVRTLAEELWGEVDHSFNYPYPHGCVACREQIKVLARATSTCSRLVDAIYASKDEYEKRKKCKRRGRRG